MQKTFKRISRKTKKLLEQGESSVVDYKKKVSGLHATDFVAFANSVSGGTILVGVIEEKTKSGEMIGKVTGQPISDDVILQIVQKSNSCNPIIKIEIIRENTGEVPFIRIDIPSGESKPYCDGNGTYKIRTENQNATLRPKELLDLFLNSEEKRFTSRFSQASAMIEVKLSETFQSIESLEGAIEDKLDEILWDISSAENEAEDASRKIDDVEAIVK